MRLWLLVAVTAMACTAPLKPSYLPVSPCQREAWRLGVTTCMVCDCSEVE